MKNKHFYTAVILLLFLAVGIQPAIATIYLTNSGWKDENGNTLPDDLYLWDEGSLTGTLNTNVYETIKIINDGITLNGGGCKISGVAGPGVHLYQRSLVTIQNLEITGCADGICLSISSNVIVNNNNIHYNNNNGISIVAWEHYANYNTLSNNTVSSNAGAGISLGSGNTDENTIKNNTVSNNLRGIYLSSGAHLNKIYNNNFIGNTPNADVIGGYPGEPESYNVFDDGDPAEGGKGGNYWCNWCPEADPPKYDNDGDGIVDEPYVMPPYYNRGQDNFPWAVPDGWSTPTPPTAEEELVELIEKVEGYNGEFGINNALDAKLQNALDALTAKNAGQRQDAVNKMQSFINAVEAQRDNKIPVEVADELIADAQQIIDLILAE